MKTKLMLFLLLISGLPCLGCRDDGQAATGGAATSSNGAPPTPITNRVDVPDAVRRNLGITFARVEARSVSQTIRVPGRFEFLPDARREYRTMLAGRVELMVKQFQRVEPGTPLYRLDSPSWNERQQKLAETEAEVREFEKRVEMMEPLLKAHEQHHRSIEEQVRILTAQAERLRRGAEGGSVSTGELSQVQAALAESNTKLAEVIEKEAQLAVMRVKVSAKLDAARRRFGLLQDSAAMVLGISYADRNQNNNANDTALFWHEYERVEVVAGSAGQVDSISVTNGAWVDATSLVLTTVEPEKIRFHAHGMQSDLGRFRDGLPARVVPPRGGTIELQDTMQGTLSLGVAADPEQRTIDLYVVPARLTTWARSGVTAHLEITLAETTDELAIPVGAVIQDGLNKLFFRRDPKDPDKVIRMMADLGVSDGRWIVVKSGLREGDEVVFDGVYQLMLATSADSPKGGHFHPDGTFHEGNE